MKKKRSFKRVIMLSFIEYTIGIALTLLILELLFSLFTFDNGMNFSELASSPLTEETQKLQIILSVFWNLITAAVYLIGIVLFGRRVSRKILKPVQHMQEGFKAVTAGNLDTTLDFETETEFGEMRDAFNYMVQRLKESEKKRMIMEHERMQLFSHIAHDLKTPMTTIYGYAGALARGMVDSLEMSRAIGNLLTNAIRHNPAGSLLSVNLTDEPGHIEIQIADNGAAIPEAIAGNLFEPFVSGSDSRSASSGTGLGLAIVKKVMEQHFGEVFVSKAASPYTKAFILHFPKLSAFTKMEVSGYTKTEVSADQDVGFRVHQDGG